MCHKRNSKGVIKAKKHSFRTFIQKVSGGSLNLSRALRILLFFIIYLLLVFADSVSREVQKSFIFGGRHKWTTTNLIDWMNVAVTRDSRGHELSHQMVQKNSCLLFKSFNSLWIFNPKVQTNRILVLICYTMWMWH